jgi:hypothetical protein
MKPPSNVKTPGQYIASLPADRAKTIATVRGLVNKHIPRGYDECLVWGTIGWTIPLSRYPDTYNKQPICYVALSSHLPLEAIGKLISAISSEKWIEMYEQSRLMTKAGQAQRSKQGAPSASTVTAKRVDTKRGR